MGKAAKKARLKEARENQPMVRAELESAVSRAFLNTSDLPREMTTAQAAEFLDVSRHFVVKLVASHQLPCRMVGKDRRIPTDALVAYREKMFRRAKEEMDSLSQWTQGQGISPLE